MYSIPVVYQYTSIHCDISYTIIGSLYEVVYCIRNVHYTSIRLYEYPLIRVSAAPWIGSWGYTQILDKAGTQPLEFSLINGSTLASYSLQILS